MIKSVWVLIGITSLFLGVIGIILPILPTTPFILISAAAFAKSSPRLHSWMINHSRWGPIIKNWQDGGRIDKRSKATALCIMAVMPILSYVFGAPIWAIGAQSFILILVATFIITRPS